MTTVYSACLSDCRCCAVSAGLISVIITKLLLFIVLCCCCCVQHYYLIFCVTGTTVRLRNDLYCVEWGVKLYSLTHSPVPLWRIKMNIKRILKNCGAIQKNGRQMNEIGRRVYK